MWNRTLRLVRVSHSDFPSSIGSRFAFSLTTLYWYPSKAQVLWPYIETAPMSHSAIDVRRGPNPRPHPTKGRWVEYYSRSSPWMGSRDWLQAGIHSLNQALGVQPSSATRAIACGTQRPRRGGWFIVRHHLALWNVWALFDQSDERYEPSALWYGFTQYAPLGPPLPHEVGLVQRGLVRVTSSPRMGRRRS